VLSVSLAGLALFVLGVSAVFAVAARGTLAVRLAVGALALAVLAIGLGVWGTRAAPTACQSRLNRTGTYQVSGPDFFQLGNPNEQAVYRACPSHALGVFDPF
jgi:hypothetical protein